MAICDFSQDTFAADLDIYPLFVVVLDVRHVTNERLIASFVTCDSFVAVKCERSDALHISPPTVVITLPIGHTTC